MGEIMGLLGFLVFFLWDPFSPQIPVFAKGYYAFFWHSFVAVRYAHEYGGLRHVPKISRDCNILYKINLTALPRGTLLTHVGRF